MRATRKIIILKISVKSQQYRMIQTEYVAMTSFTLLVVLVDISWVKSFPLILIKVNISKSSLKETDRTTRDTRVGAPSSLT